MAPIASDAEEPALSRAERFQTYARKLFFCLAYIVVSACLIRFNKTMMSKGHYPHSMALSCFHMVVSSVLCMLVYLVRPSMLPGMEVTRGNRLELMKWFVPIGVCFAVMLFGSNSAYRYCSVTFLQFMKEANVMLVFVISCIIGLQSCDRLKSLIIVWVIAGASIAVSGEVHFAWTGFAFQAVSQLAEVSRMIMGEILLGSKRLDPLTYNLFLAPICCVVLVIGNVIHFSPGTFSDIPAMWPLLIGNACVAFLLNLSVAAVIKECSAVGFVLCGLTKDMFIVIVSACVYHEQVTPKQCWGFAITLAGVFYWSLCKANPDSPLVTGLERILCMVREGPGETDMLIKKV